MQHDRKVASRDRDITHLSSPVRCRLPTNVAACFRHGSHPCGYEPTPEVLHFGLPETRTFACAGQRLLALRPMGPGRVVAAAPPAMARSRRPDHIHNRLSDDPDLQCNNSERSFSTVRFRDLRPLDRRCPVRSPAMQARVRISPYLVHVTPSTLAGAAFFRLKKAARSTSGVTCLDIR